jgi:hypothetical protein
MDTRAMVLTDYPVQVTCANDHPYDRTLDDVNNLEGAVETKYVRLQSG